MKSSRKVAFVVLAAGFGIAGLALLLQVLPQDWTRALSASTTVVLAVTTGIYAYFTYRSVTLQENPPHIRLVAQDKAAANLATAFAKHLPTTSFLKAHFPLQAASGATLSKDFIEDMDVLRRFNEELGLLFRLLPPTLVISALQASNAIFDYLNPIDALKISCKREEQEADRAQRPFDWGRVRNIYDAEFRAQDSDTYPEWATLLGGERLKEALEMTAKLEKDLDAYLLQFMSSGP